MALRDLISWGRDQPSVPSRRGDEVSPFLTLHREMNRLFDDVFNTFGNTPSVLGRMPAWPSVEVVASDKDVRVCLAAGVSGGLKSHSVRGPGPISEGGGNASPARRDGRYGEASEARRRKPGHG